jgi:hypothetical protein
MVARLCTSPVTVHAEEAICAIQCTVGTPNQTEPPPVEPTVRAFSRSQTSMTRQPPVGLGPPTCEMEPLRLGSEA